VNRDAHVTLKSDSLAASHPIYVPVEHPNDVLQIFDSISYSKVENYKIYHISLLVWVVGVAF